MKKKLKMFNMPRKVMAHFYSAVIEFTLTSSIATWYAAASARDESRLHHSALNVIRCNLSSL